MQNVKDSFDTIDFEVFYRVRSKIGLQRSGGIMIAAKSSLNHCLKLIRGTSDSYLSLMLDKARLGLEKHVIITVVYIPPSNSRYSCVELLESLDNFLLDYYADDYYHVLCGDFNAHTSVVPDIDHVSDYVSNDDHSKTILDMLNNLMKCNIPIESYSCGASNVNSYGKRLLDMCKNNMVCIYNGKVDDDLRIGKATTVFNTVIDYIIGSLVLLTMVQTLKVYDFGPLFSDVHCGIVFTLKNSQKKERNSYSNGN